MSNLSKVEKAHKEATELEELRILSSMSGLASGQKLYNLKKSNMYKKAYGPDVDTWEKFLSQPEIAMSVTEAKRLIDIYEYFCLERGYKLRKLLDIPTKALAYIMPRAKSNKLEEDKLGEILESAKVLSYKDLKDRLYDIQTAEDSGPRTYSYMIMRKCNETGNLSKVHNIKNEHILQAFPNIDNEN